MEPIIAWLSGTQAYSFIRYAGWIIPTVQTLHILSICVVLSSVLLLNLRFVGVVGSGLSMDVFTRRYLPWVWSALLLLVLTGLTLVVAEPERDLQNPTFWTKMGLIVAAVVVTLVLEKPLLRNAKFWESGARRWASQFLALVAIALWISIVLSGRWIAYTY
jgi:uncharacterized membrane protein SirB2